MPDSNNTTSGSGVATNPAVDVFNNIVAADLQVILAPVNKFLTDLQQPGANTQEVIADFSQLQLAALADVPLFESVGIQNIAAGLQMALNNWVSSVTPKAAVEENQKKDESSAKEEVSK